MLPQFKENLEVIENEALDSLPFLNLPHFESQLVDIFFNYPEDPDALEAVRITYDFILSLYTTSLKASFLNRISG